MGIWLSNKTVKASLRITENINEIIVNLNFLNIEKLQYNSFVINYISFFIIKSNNSLRGNRRLHVTSDMSMCREAANVHKKLLS
jgi:hypothetical protein